MAEVYALNLAELKSLHDINMELLWANLEALREVKEYCRRNGLPPPQLDEALSYRVSQLLDLVETINLPDETLQKKRRRGLDSTILWVLVTWLRTTASSAIPLTHPPVVCVTFSFLDPYPCPHHDSFILASAFWTPCYHKLIG